MAKFGYSSGGSSLATRSPQAVAKRNLALTLRDMISDDEIGRFLIAVMYGEVPGRPSGAPDGAAFRAVTRDGVPVKVAEPPAVDMTHRLKAAEMLLARRDGQPMQAIALVAELSSHARKQAAGSDVVDVEDLDAAGARLLERALGAALAIAVADPEDEGGDSSAPAAAT